MWNPFIVKCSTKRESEYKKISWAIKLQIGFLWSNLDNKYVIWLTDRDFRVENRRRKLRYFSGIFMTVVSITTLRAY